MIDLDAIERRLRVIDDDECTDADAAEFAEIARHDICALLAEVRRLQEEVKAVRARVTGNIAEPIGCPTPGACSCGGASS